MALSFNTPSGPPVTAYEGASFWLATAGEALTPRPALTGEIKCDIAIAGAGFTGLWTAYFLKKQVPGLDIVLLDAHVAGYGASGRNGGWCAGEMLNLEAWLEDPATRAAAQALQRRLFETVKRVGAIAGEEGIDCHYARDGMVTLAANQGEFTRLAAFASRMEAFGFGGDFTLLTREEAHRHLANDQTVGGLYSPHCAAIHPARLARGLARGLENVGVRIFERSRVARLEDGAFVLDGGRVSAGLCILACEGYTPQIAGYGRALAPVHSRMIATEPLDAATLRASGLSTRVCFGDAKRLVGYGQLTQDGRIAFGARGDYHFGSLIEDRVTRDDARIRLVRERLLALVPAVSDVPVAYAWTGPLGVSRARKPFVFLDKQRKFAWAGGYLGQGVAASCLAGDCLADALLAPDGAPNDPLLFGALPPRFEPEPVRWLGTSAYRQWWALLDRLGR